MLNNNNLRTFSYNAFSLFIVKGFDLALTLFLIPFLICKVGISNYGVYAFSMSMMLFFLNILNYGFDLSAVRELVICKDNPKEISEILNRVVSVKFFLIIFLYLLIFSLVIFIPRLYAYKELCFFASLILIGDLFSLRWFFLGLEKMKFISAMSAVISFIYVLFSFLLINSKSDYIYIPLAEAIGMFFVSVSSFVWVIMKYKISFRILQLGEVINYLKLNFSSFLNLFLPSTYGVTIVFLVGIFGIPYDVTIMQVGIKFTSGFSTINTVLSTVFYPMVNREKKNMKPTRTILLSLGICLSIVMFFGSSFLISNWLKLDNTRDLRDMVQLTQILSPVPFLLGVISSYGVNGLLVYFKDQVYSRITIFSSLVMIVISVFLVPKFHFFGGAVAFLLGKLLSAIVLYLVYMTSKFNYISK